MTRVVRSFHTVAPETGNVRLSIVSVCTIARILYTECMRCSPTTTNKQTKLQTVHDLPTSCLSAGVDKINNRFRAIIQLRFVHIGCGYTVHCVTVSYGVLRHRSIHRFCERRPMPLCPGVKFSGSWWELGSHTSHLSSHTLLTGSHISHVGSHTLLSSSHTSVYTSQTYVQLCNYSYIKQAK